MIEREEMSTTEKELVLSPDSKGNHIRKFITVILGIVIISLFVGISYSIWNYTFLGNENVIETGNIKVEFLESNSDIISLNSALPMFDEDGKEENSFDFAVTSYTGMNLEIDYELYIEELSVTSGYTKLNSSQMKVYLTDYSDNELVSPTLISDLDNFILYQGNHLHSSDNVNIVEKFKLRAWIAYEVDATDWTEETKLEYKFRVGVRAVEKQEIVTYPVYRWSDNTVQLGDNISVIGEYVNDYTTLGKNHFLKHNIGPDGNVVSSEACYILNETIYCLKSGAGNFEESKNTMLESFGEGNCFDHTNYYFCAIDTDDLGHSSFSSDFYSDGYVRVMGAWDATAATYPGCLVDADGISYCGVFGGNQ